MRAGPVIAAATGLALAAVLLPTAAPASAAATATLTGTVLDQSGVPLPGMTVISGSAAYTTTDANGHFSFDGLTAGDPGNACALPPVGYRGGTSPTGYRSTCSASRVLTAGRNVANVRVAPGGAATGVIVDDRTGTPIAGASADWLDREPEGGKVLGSVTANPYGRWLLTSAAPSHTYRFGASAARSSDAPFGYIPIDNEGPGSEGYFTLRAAQTRTVPTLRLHPGTRLSGTVELPAGIRGVGIITNTGGGAFSQGKPFTATVPAAYGAAAPGEACAIGGGSESDPRGAALQCVATPLSYRAAATVHFAPTIGGAVRGTITGFTPTTTIWVDVDGIRVQGYPSSTAAGFWLGSLPTGRYVVHALDPATGASGQSAPVNVFEGHIRAGVDLTLA